MAAATTVDAKKTRLPGEEALKMASQAEELFVAKGSKIVHFDLKKDNPSKEILLSHMLGPTGNLRAPTMRIGKTLVVGFNEIMLKEAFGKTLIAK